MTVDGYIAGFDGRVKARLEQMRKVVRETVPDAEESMSYCMPAYKLRGKPLVYYGGYPHHIGFYATPNGHEAFARDFAPYKQGKGSVQFPHDEPLPLDLVKRVVIYRATQLTK